MGKFSRMAAVICLMCQGALPAISCPCPNPRNPASRVNCGVRPLQTPEAKPAKAKCTRCARAKACASRKAVAEQPISCATATQSCATDSSRNCAACPFRQAKREPVQPFVPADTTRDQGATPVATAVLAVLDAVETCSEICSADFEPAAVPFSHNERQSQIVCWLK